MSAREERREESSKIVCMGERKGGRDPVRLYECERGKEEGSSEIVCVRERKGGGTQ